MCRWCGLSIYLFIYLSINQSQISIISLYVGRNGGEGGERSGVRKRGERADEGRMRGRGGGEQSKWGGARGGDGAKQGEAQTFRGVA